MLLLKTVKISNAWKLIQQHPLRIFYVYYVSTNNVTVKLVMNITRVINPSKLDKNLLLSKQIFIELPFEVNKFSNACTEPLFCYLLSSWSSATNSSGHCVIVFNWENPIINLFITKVTSSGFKQKRNQNIHWRTKTGAGPELPSVNFSWEPRVKKIYQAWHKRSSQRNEAISGRLRIQTFRMNSTKGWWCPRSWNLCAQQEISLVPRLRLSRRRSLPRCSSQKEAGSRTRAPGSCVICLNLPNLLSIILKSSTRFAQTMGIFITRFRIAGYLLQWDIGSRLIRFCDGNFV